MNAWENWDILVFNQIYILRRSDIKGCTGKLR